MPAQSTEHRHLMEETPESRTKRGTETLQCLAHMLTFGNVILFSMHVGFEIQSYQKSTAFNMRAENLRSETPPFSLRITCKRCTHGGLC